MNKQLLPSGGRRRSSASGISWQGPVTRRAALAVVALLAMVVALLPVPTQATDDAPQSYVVRMADSGIDGERLIEAAGGTVTARLAIIDGFAAELSAIGVGELLSDPAVASVTPDGAVRLTGWENTANGDMISMSSVADKIVDADVFWNDGFTGAGIDVALIDSGVSSAAALTTPGKVLNGPDLSFESQNANRIHEDSYGHGTHLAGIIAGRDANAPSRITTKDANRNFLGMAPDARVVSVKVADRKGLADVSQVIAAIDWVVQHRNDNGMNIKVLNLSFGTDGSQSYILDPLAFAVEQAWHKGIVVVVAAGNDGANVALRNPAMDPFVIAVGASDHRGTFNTKDDRVAQFSSCGTAERSTDLVAPGKSIVSSMASGSKAATDHPEAIVDGTYIVGSGTSQAAAVVSGAAALVINARPGISPDQVKALLMSTAQSTGGSKLCQGAGVLDLAAAKRAATPTATQNFATATGTGTLEGARGSYHLEHDGVVLEGEQDIFGNAFEGASWSSLAAAGASWSGGYWNGASWSGASWSGASWSGASWSGASWSGASWSGASWSGMSWSGMSWSGASWSSDAWLGLSWNGPAKML